MTFSSARELKCKPPPIRSFNWLIYECYCAINCTVHTCAQMIVKLPDTVEHFYLKGQHPNKEVFHFFNKDRLEGFHSVQYIVHSSVRVVQFTL